MGSTSVSPEYRDHHHHFPNAGNSLQGLLSHDAGALPFLLSEQHRPACLGRGTGKIAIASQINADEIGGRGERCEAVLPRNCGDLLARCGNALWLFVAGEHYQNLQTTLRARFSNRPLIVATITDGWQPGYIPPADVYSRGIYQAEIAVVAPGSAEQLLAAAIEQIEALLK